MYTQPDSVSALMGDKPKAASADYWKAQYDALCAGIKEPIHIENAERIVAAACRLCQESADLPLNAALTVMFRAVEWQRQDRVGARMEITPSALAKAKAIIQGWKLSETMQPSADTEAGPSSGPVETGGFQGRGIL